MRKFTQDEDELIRGIYDSQTETIDELVSVLDCLRWEVTHRAKVLGVSKKGTRRWTEAEVNILNDQIGLVSDETLCARLNRTKVAIILKSKRISVNHKSNFYTATSLAKLFGIPCSKTIISWMQRGWLEGQRAGIKQGSNYMWAFSEDQVVNCLRQRPWLVCACKMEIHFFRSLVEKEWEKNPWYISKQAASLLGLRDVNALHRYIRRGWLRAVRKPGGPHQ